jgi:putative colanic acid biosynthesis acetyltransferase WcaF
VVNATVWLRRIGHGDRTAPVVECYISAGMYQPPPSLSIDLQANRAADKYSRAEQLRRIAWSLGRWLIRLSPRPCFAWRRLVMRLFGARVGQHVHVYPSTHLYMPWNVQIGDWSALGEDVFVYSLGKVTIGQRVTVSYRAHICAGTHDFTDPTLRLLKPPVTLADDVWIGTDAFIGPGVSLGRGVIVGARAVVVKNVDPMLIVVGHPAHSVGRRGTPACADQDGR